MTSSTYCIGPFRAENINLSGSDFVSGILSPGAALGFAGALARKLSQTGWGHRVVLVVHDLQTSNGRPKGGLNNKKKPTLPLEIPESITGRGTFTLMIEIPGSHDISEVTSEFLRLRFAGGSIFPVHGRILSEVVQPLSDENFAQVVRRLPRGMVLSPPTDRADTSVVSFGELTSLEQIAMRAYSSEERKKGGFIVPIAAGYLIHPETYTDKAPPRSRAPDVPFALSDSGVGLAEYFSIKNREMLTDLETAFQKRGWAWACNKKKHLKMFSSFHLNSVI
jgi:hypothetical protein